MLLIHTDVDLRRFMEMLKKGSCIAALAMLRGVSDGPLVERVLTLALSKVTRGRCEIVRSSLLRRLAGIGVFDRAHLTDPLALYSSAMEHERCFLAALVLQEEIVGLDETVRNKLLVNAVQAAFTKAAIEHDELVLDHLRRAFPEYGITQEEGVPEAPDASYVELTF